MYKSEVIEIMCQTVEEFNRYMAKSQNVSQEQTEETISQMRPQLFYMNSLIYDALKDNGVIG
jgi:hypothetical protein